MRSIDDARMSGGLTGMHIVIIVVGTPILTCLACGALRLLGQIIWERCCLSGHARDRLLAREIESENDDLLSD